MMLMLLLGHVLAISNPRFIKNFINFFCTLLLSWFMVRKKIIDYASQFSISINCLGTMIWHGGISGSSLVKISEGHLTDLAPETVL